LSPLHRVALSPLHRVALSPLFLSIAASAKGTQHDAQQVSARSRGTRFTLRRCVAITLSIDQAMPLDEDDPASGGDAAAAACMLRISSRKSSRRRRWPSLSNPSSCPPYLSCHYSNDKHAHRSQQSEPNEVFRSSPAPCRCSTQDSQPRGTGETKDMPKKSRQGYKVTMPSDAIRRHLTPALRQQEHSPRGFLLRRQR
jgi:hypothetical protein